jgi:hypothetical protein
VIVPILLAVQQVPAPDVPSEDEIVLIGQRRFIDVDISAPRRQGYMVLQHCRVIRPSGYPELDAIPCEVARKCVRDNPASRKLLMRCIENGSNRQVDAVVAAWRARR